MNLLFLDTETTGLGEGARMVQVAFKSSLSQEIVHGKFKPPVPIEIGAMAIHHITNKEVESLEGFDDSYIKEALVSLLKKTVLVAHNAPFDIGILENEGLNVPEFIDTLVCAKHLIKSERHSLQYLRYFLELDVEAQAHDAVGDIIVLEKLYEKLENAAAIKFELDNEEKIHEKMMELSNMPVLIENFSFGKHKGKTFEEVASEDRGYLEWLLKSETGKPKWNQKKELVYTLEHHLNG